jgi:hypothetical protein
MTKERPRCYPCQLEQHENCTNLIETGRLIPDTDPYREATRMIPEYKFCECVCRVSAHV